MSKHTNKTSYILSIAHRLLGGLKLVFLLVALTGVFLYTRAGAPTRVDAATSSYLNFQARIYNAGGTLVPDGNYNIEFKIYDSLASGASGQGVCVGGGTDDCLWVETRTGGSQVTVKNGYFSVHLGEVASLPNINWDQDLWLTMNIGGTGSPSWDGEMAPRIKLTAVPYAFAAGSLTKVNGGNSGILQFGSVSNDPNILLPNIGGGQNSLLLQAGTTSFTQGSIPFTDNLGRLTQDNNNFFWDASGIGELGLGTNSPGARLQVNGGASGIGIIVQANATTPGNLVEFRDSSGTVLSGFNSAGELFLRDPTSGNTATIVVEGGTINNDVEFRLPDVDAGVATICTTSGNCIGNGGAGDIFNGGQNGPVVIGTDDDTSLFLQTDDTDRIEIDENGVVAVLSGQLEIGVASTLTGDLTFFNQNNAHGATLRSAELTQPTVFTLPDVNFATAEVCVKYDSNSTNCAGSGSSVTQTGPNDQGQIAFFTSNNNITSQADFFFDAPNVRLGIGDGSPDYRLEVQGQNGSGYFAISNAGEGDILEVDTNGDVFFGGSVTLAAEQTITLTGGTTAQRPAGTPGQLYYDTDTDQLLVYNGTKWMADRASVTKTVAPSNASQAIKDSADYVADGTSDEDEINAALTAAAGGKVYLFEGTFTADGTILVPNNTTLAGSGKGTVIELADIDTTDNLIENSDTSTGAGVTIRDLTLNGRKDLNTSGTQYGIYLNGMGDQATSRDGSMLTGLWVGNFRHDGVRLNNSELNSIIGNTSANNSSAGFLLAAASDHNNLTGNIATGNVNGFWVDNSSYNLLTGNTIQSSSGHGIYLAAAHHNTVSANNLYSNGGAGSNNSINLSSADSNLITSNRITDTIGSGYAINIANNTSDNNYLADNYYSGTGATAINDSGTGTIYGGQLNGNDFQIQPSASINLITGTSTDLVNILTGNLKVGNGTPDLTLNGEDAYIEGTLEVDGISRFDDIVLIGATSAGTDARLTVNANGTADNDAAVQFNAGAADQIALVVQGFSGQTETIFEVQNSAGGRLLFVTSGGTLFANGDVASGTGVFRTVDQTNASTNSVAATFRSGNVSGATSNSGDVTVGSGNSTTSGDTGNVTITTGIATSGDSGDIIIDAGSASGTAGNVTIGGTYASAILIGNGTDTPITLQSGTNSVIFTGSATDITTGTDQDLTVVANGTGVIYLNDTVRLGALPGSADTDALLCLDSNGYINSCQNAGLGGDAFIQGGNAFGDTAVLGTTDTEDLTFITDGNLALTIDTAGDARFEGNLVIAAGKALTLEGGNTASRPVAPDEGMLYYDTDTHQLLIYNGTKWIADRGEYIIVAADDSTQAQKDSADYVADGTSDQTEINAALTAGAGGKVLLLPGTYVIDDVISVPNNTTLAGSGKDTVIEAADIDDDLRLIQATGTNRTGQTIRDLTLDGRDDLNTTGFQWGLDIQNVGSTSPFRTGITITNVIARNFVRGVGMQIENSPNTSISGSTLVNNQYGINSWSTYVTLTSNIAQGNEVGISAGSWSFGDSHNTIVGNTAYDSAGSGFRFGVLTQSTVTGNTATTNGWGGGFLFDESSNNTVTGNNASGNYGHGFMFENGSNGNVISGNNIHDNGDVNAYDGIRIEASDNNIITSNRITDTAGVGGYAIEIVSGTANYLADNIYSGTGAASVEDNGTNTIYGGQHDDSGNFVIQPAGSIELIANTNITGNLDVSGSLTVGASDEVVISSTGVITLNPLTASTALCLNASKEVISCTGSGGTDPANTLQNAYINGNSITSTNAEGDITFNLTEATNFNVDIQGTGGFLVKDGGTTVLTIDATGDFIYQSSVDSVTGFQILDNSGTPIINVDTQNERVGIGTAAPSQALHISSGAVLVQPDASWSPGDSANIYLGDTNTFVRNIDGTGATISSNNTLTLQNTTNGNIVINSVGTIELQDNTNVTGNLNVDSNTLFVDAASDRVGVGDATPDYKFEIQGSSGSGYFALTNSSDGDILNVDSAGQLRINNTGTADVATAKLYVVGNSQIEGVLRVGDDTNYVETNGSGQFRFFGSARNSIAVTLSPEFAGAVITGDGGGDNTGIMTSDFCSDDFGINNGGGVNPCDTGEEHNYYSWTANAGNDYDIWLKWQVPSNFDSFDTTPVQFNAWSTSANNSVIVTFYKGSTACDTKTISNSGGWTLDSSIDPAGGCTINPGDVLKIRVKMVISTGGVLNTDFVRMGEIFINYRSAF